MLAALGISARIHAGFTVVLALLAGLAAFAFVSVSGLIGVFADYRATARDSLGISEIVETLGETRLERLIYAADPSDAGADTVRAQLDAIDAATAQAAESFADPETAARIAALAPLSAEYRAAFERQVEAVRSGRALWRDFQTTGGALFVALDQLIRTLAMSGEPELALEVAHVSIYAFQGRLRAAIYMADHDQAELNWAINRIDVVRNEFAKLAPDFDTPRLSELRGAVEAEIDAVAERLAAAAQAIGAAAREDDRLAYEIGPKLSRALAEAHQAVVGRQNALGPQAADSMARTQSVSLIIGAGALLLGAALAFLIGRWIAGAVAGMAGVMTRMAGGDLEMAVEGDQHRHELGAMARALKSFQKAGIEKRRMDAEAEAARLRDAEAARERAALQSAVAEVVDAAAQGDFGRRVDPRYKDDGL
ncbi:methyl-accepting chemotaxis protein, partial [Rubrimonas sp.]|uniref:methyl-accepting chemotaxis protein n=1 Tax=Rubrimonas sp. TaxID=2036015 RepID=UPI002FDE19E2